MEQLGVEGGEHGGGGGEVVVPWHALVDTDGPAGHEVFDDRVDVGATLTGGVEPALVGVGHQRLDVGDVHAFVHAGVGFERHCQTTKGDARPVGGCGLLDR